MKTPFFITIFLISNFHLLAQWESMHGPFGSTINDLGQNDHYVFAATTAGIYRSADAGLTWTHKSFIGDTRFPCLQFDVFDSLLIADAVEIRPDTFIRRMYKSIDNGETWIEIPRPMVNGYVEVAVVGNTIFANDQETIWITQNEGLLWKPSNVNHSFSSPGCFERFGSKVYIGSGENLLVYEGHDNNWKKITVTIAASIGSVFVKDSLILVRDYSKNDLYISEDSGATWFSSPGSQWYNFENYFATISDTLYAAGYKTIYVSSDHGHSWETRTSKSPYYNTSLIAVDSTLLLGQQYSGMYRSTDFGRQFHYSSEGIDASYVLKLFFYKDQLLTGGILQGVFNYNFLANQWQRTYLDEYTDAQCFDLEESNGQLVVAAYDVLWYDSLSGEWIKNSPHGVGPNVFYTDLFTSPLGLLAGGARYVNPGTMGTYQGSGNWNDFNKEYFDDTVSVHYFAQNDQCLFVATDSRLARSFDTGQNWEWLPILIDPHSHIFDLITIDNAVYLFQSATVSVRNRLYVSYDNGSTWALADDGIPLDSNHSGPSRLIEAGDYLVCSSTGSNGGVYFSRKDQLHWYSFNEGLTELNIKDVVSDGEYLYTAIVWQGVWKRKVDEIKITNTQDEKPVYTSSLQLFPNPTNGQFFIHLDADNLIGAILKMYDLQGKVVFEKIISNPNSAIEIGNLPNGLYGVELKTNTGCYTAKLLVQF